jgi:hypothetical protein
MLHCQVHTIEVNLTDTHAHSQSATHGWTHRQTHRQTDRQTDRETDIQSYRQSDIHTHVCCTRAYDTNNKHDITTRPSTNIAQPQSHMVTDTVDMLFYLGEWNEPRFSTDTPTRNDSLPIVLHYTSWGHRLMIDC